jgi:predicted nucleic acid-binding protein
LGELTETLRRHDLVGIDTSIFIYQVEGSPRYAALAEEALSALSNGVFKGVTSVLTLMEVAVRPLQLGRHDAADEYELLLVSFPNLAVVELDRDCARRAAELRATYRLRPADSLQVAACLRHGATALLTNDKGLRRIQELDVVILDDFVSET